MSITRFTDNINTIDDGLIWVHARIALLSKLDGGRSGPFTKGFRPNHNFGGLENRAFYIGEIVIQAGEWVYPGETRDVPIRFFNVYGLREKLSPGNSWRIQEGHKLIANATVLSHIEASNES